MNTVMPTSNCTCFCARTPSAATRHAGALALKAAGTTTQCRSTQQLQNTTFTRAVHLLDAVSYGSLRQQQQQQHQQRGKARPRPEQDVCRAVSLRLKRASSTADVLTVIGHHATRFNEVNTALAFAQLARQLRFDSSSSRAAALQHHSYQQLLQLASQQAGTLNPRQVTMILTSLAWMHSSSSCDTELQQQQQQQQAAATTTDLQQAPEQPYQVCSSPEAAAAAAAAAAAFVVVEPLVELLASRLQQQLDAAEPEDICHCLWAAAKLGQLHSPACSQLLDATTHYSCSAGWLHVLTAKPLSSLLWVHAQRQQQQQQQQQGPKQEGPGQQQQQQLGVLLSGVMHELSQPGFLATWTPQELSMLLWSCAVLRLQVGDPQQQQQEQQQQEQQQQLPLLPYAVVEEVCRLAVQQVVRFTPQGIANTCLALAKLLAPAGCQQQQQQQYEGASQLVRPSEQQGRLQGLIKDAAAAAAAAVGPGSCHNQQQQRQQSVVHRSVHDAVEQLFAVFTAAAAAQLHYYKPQEVANLWSACARLQQQQQQQQQLRHRRQQYNALNVAVGQYVLNHSHWLSPRDAFELLVGFVQLKTLVEPSVVHALVHRLSQGSEQLQPYEAAAAAWGLVRLAEGQHQQQYVGSTAAQSPQQQQLMGECLAVARALLDVLSNTMAAAGSTAALVDDEELQQLLVDPYCRPLVLLLWAMAGSDYLAAGDASAAQQHGTQEQQQQQQQWNRRQLLDVVLQHVELQVATCSIPTLVQLLCMLTRVQPVVLQQPHESAMQLEQAWGQGGCVLVARVCRAAQARLLPVLQQLPAQQVVLCAWALVKLTNMTARYSTAADAAVQVANNAEHTAAAAAAAAAVAAAAVAPAAEAAAGDTRSAPVRDASTAGFLEASLAVLQQQQQLQRLPGYATVALLWCCSAAHIPLSHVAQQELLGGVEQQLLQLQEHQLVVLLQALARLQQQQQQQQQRGCTAQQQQQQRFAARQQHSQLTRQVANELLSRLQQQLLSRAGSNNSSSGRMSSTQSGTRNGRKPGSLVAGGGVVASSAGRMRSCSSHYGHLPHHWQQQQLLGAQQLLSIAAACVQLPQLHSSELLLAVVELWQLQLSERRVQATQAVQMLWTLANSSGTVAVQQLNGLAAQLPHLLQQTLPLLQQHLVQRQQEQQQQEVAAVTAAPELVLACRLFAKLQFQPPPSLVQLLCQQVQHSLPALSRSQMVLALHALAQLALPVQGLAAAVAAEIIGRQKGAARAVAVVAAKGGEAADASAYHRPPPPPQQQQQLQQQPPSPLRYDLKVLLLWSLLAARYRSGHDSGALKWLLTRLARDVLGVPEDSEQQQQQQQRQSRKLEQYRSPQLLQLEMQCLQLLFTPRYSTVKAAVCSCGVVLRSQAELLQQLRQLQATHQAESAGTPAASQDGDSSAAAGGAIFPAATAGVQYDVQQLLYMWQQQRLQRLGLEAVAAELAAAGVSPGRIRLSRSANGDMTLLLSLAASSSTSNNSRERGLSKCLPVSGSGGSNSSIGVAVVLEGPGSRATNTRQPLGPSVVRSLVLASKGHAVYSMPLEPWLPAWTATSSSAVQGQGQGPGYHLRHGVTTVSVAGGKAADRQMLLQRLLHVIVHS